jgi:hypothetical protein
VPPRTLTALPELRQKITGRADPVPTCSRCRRTPAHRNPNPAKAPMLTANDAHRPAMLILNGV